MQLVTQTQEYPKIQTVFPFNLVRPPGRASESDGFVQIVTLNISAGVSQTVRAEIMNLLLVFREEAKNAINEAQHRDPKLFGVFGE